MQEYGRVVEQMRHIIDSNPEERKIQEFLEKNPCLLVDMHIASNVVISQFPLGADHRCDFAFLGLKSSGNYLQLIEIESPRLELFNEKDEFSSAFNHSVQQLEDWDGWASKNRESIVYMLEPLMIEGTFTDIPNFVRVELRLVAGRRSQLSNARRKRRWEERINKLPRNTKIRTFEGFVESLPLGSFEHMIGATDVTCVRYRKQGYGEM